MREKQLLLGQFYPVFGAAAVYFLYCNGTSREALEEVLLVRYVQRKGKVQPKGRFVICKSLWVCIMWVNVNEGARLYLHKAY